jgi:hypothetical protein
VFSQGNRELSRFEAELPERPSGEAPRAFKRVPPAPNAAPRRKPAPPAETPPPVDEPEEPGIAVRFTGFMGGKAALRVAEEGGEREQTRLTQPGDEIGAGWVLHEIDEESSVLVVRHTTTEREVRLPRGPDSVILKP